MLSLSQLFYSCFFFQKVDFVLDKSCLCRQFLQDEATQHKVCLVGSKRLRIVCFLLWSFLWLQRPLWEYIPLKQQNHPLFNLLCGSFFRKIIKISKQGMKT